MSAADRQLSQANLRVGLSSHAIEIGCAAIGVPGQPGRWPGLEMRVQTLSFLMRGKWEESALPSLPRNSKKAVSPSFLTTFVQDRHEAPGRSNVDLSAGDPPPFFAIAPHSPGPRRTGRRAGRPALCSRLERKGEVPIEGEVS
jgi:hypothetical protein